MDHILNELDKISKEQGVVSYNIQEKAIEDDAAFRDSIKQQKDQIEIQLTQKKSKEEKKQMKDSLMQPLLDLDSDEVNPDYKDEEESKKRTPRKTPRDLMGESTPIKKKGTNLISAGCTFVDKRQNKAKLMQEEKEFIEKEKRE